MPYGRGGAGNIEEQQRVETQRAEDVEAQRQSTAKAVAEALAGESSDPAEYAFSGRGGSGNVYSPRALETEGTFTRTEMVAENAQTGSGPTLQRRPSVVSIQQKAPIGMVKVGRGGAGNYEFGSSQAPSKETIEQLEKEKQHDIQSAVEQAVEDVLAPPPKARIATAGVYRG